MDYAVFYYLCQHKQQMITMKTGTEIKWKQVVVETLKLNLKRLYQSKFWHISHDRAQKAFRQLALRRKKGMRMRGRI